MVLTTKWLHKVREQVEIMDKTVTGWVMRTRSLTFAPLLRLMLSLCLGLDAIVDTRQETLVWTSCMVKPRMHYLDTLVLYHCQLLVAPYTWLQAQQGRA